MTKLPTLVLLAVLCALPASGDDVARAPADPTAAVAEVERAFARTMADRDHEAFKAFLSEEAVFLSGTTVRRGREAIADHWRRFFSEPEAPFSWEPETVALLGSETLAISTGPVWNAAGERISTYTSIWRREAPDVWRIVFDKGDAYCAPPDAD